MLKGTIVGMAVAVVAGVAVAQLMLRMRARSKCLRKAAVTE
jgi:hypothetical protein